MSGLKINRELNRRSHCGKRAGIASGKKTQFERIKIMKHKVSKPAECGASWDRTGDDKLMEIFLSHPGRINHIVTITMANRCCDKMLGRSSLPRSNRTEEESQRGAPSRPHFSRIVTVVRRSGRFLPQKPRRANAAASPHTSIRARRILLLSGSCGATLRTFGPAKVFRPRFLPF